MGSPRKQRTKIESPRRGWDSTRIKTESRLLDRYGMRRKRELRKAESILRGFRRQARQLAAVRNEDMEEQLLNRVSRLDLVPEDGDLDDILSLGIEDVLNRRLQTIVHRRGHANTMKQARQLITHGHVTVGDRRVTWPSFMVPKELEGEIDVAIDVTGE